MYLNMLSFLYFSRFLLAGDISQVVYSAKIVSREGGYPRVKACQLECTPPELGIENNLFIPGIGCIFTENLCVGSSLNFFLELNK